MFVTTLALLATVSPQPTSTSTAAAAPVVVEDTHGKLPWFKGTFDELMAKAKAENKIVFIDFWTTWCGWCKKLDKDTYSNDTVVAETKDLLVFNIDAESEAGVPLAKRYGVTGFPTLVFLNSDASVRDVISGYLPPPAFNTEVQRIRRGDGTVNALRKDVDADAKNLDKRWALAQKLKGVGDTAGYDAQVVELRKLDPKGESIALRSIAFDDMLVKVNELWKDEKASESPKLVEDFIAAEKHGAVLFKCHNVLAQIHGGLAQQAGDDAARTQHETAAFTSMKLAWKHTPADEVSGYGRFLGAMLLDKYATLDEADKALALEIASKLEAVTPADHEALDVAGRVHAARGDKAKALALAKRCQELAPDNKLYGQRVGEYSG